MALSLSPFQVVSYKLGFTYVCIDIYNNIQRLCNMKAACEIKINEYILVQHVQCACWSKSLYVRLGVGNSSQFKMTSPLPWLRVYLHLHVDAEVLQRMIIE